MSEEPPATAASMGFSAIQQPLAAMRALVDAERKDASRLKVSTVSWHSDVWRLRGSAVPRVWKPVFWITLWATVVAVIDLIFEKDLGLTNNVMPLLSVVIGLLLVFRNSTAFARWQEGRALYSNLSNNVRNLARFTWCAVGAPVEEHGRLDSAGKRVPYREGAYGPKERREKIAALRWMVAFVVASKHHVREEYSTDYEDLRALLPARFLAQFAKFGYGYGSVDADLTRERSASDAPPNLVGKPSIASLNSNATDVIAIEGEGDVTTPLLSSRSYDETVVVHKLNGRPTLPLPLCIAHRLQLYFAKCKAKGLLESVGPAGYNNATQTISSLVNEFTGMERLLTLPLPTIYGVHLKQTVTLYLAVLPLVLVDTLGWKIVPTVTVIAFTLLGIEGIASEIEQPYGFDKSDLPLDYMAAELRNEIEQMIARLREVPEDDLLF